jgi:hypothetical protein
MAQSAVLVPDRAAGVYDDERARLPPDVTATIMQHIDRLATRSRLLHAVHARDVLRGWCARAGARGSRCRCIRSLLGTQPTQRQPLRLTVPHEPFGYRQFVKFMGVGRG